MDKASLRKLIVGPMGVLPTPFDENYQLDLGRMNAMIQRLIDSGVTHGKGVLKIASAVGEGPMLSDTEIPALLRTAVKAADGRATIMLGIHYKDTTRAIEEAKMAQDMGAISLQVTLPIWNMPSQQDMYDFFYDLSNAIDIGIMIYHTHWMTGGFIEVETFEKLADLDNIAAIKWSVPNDDDFELMTKFTDKVNMIDNTANPVGSHKLGGRGYVQSYLDVNPKFDLKVWELLEAKQYDEAQKLYDSARIPLHSMYELVSKRTGGQSILHKAMNELMGNPVGPSRPPSKTLNTEETAELKKRLHDIGWL